ncbi:MAG TPA: shikimate dehydrogenase [Acidiferrobacteraceae bacterium]|nr:shikimate dehydrogenase [Acidiferrobacteraceae bacterium]
MPDPFDFEIPKCYAVMGNPIGHSKSPAIHSQFAQQCGIELDYTAVQVDPGGFAQAVEHFRAAGGGGLNVTVPFKVEAFKLAGRLSDRADQAGAVNTLKFGEEELYGDNTDGVGLLRDLQSNLGVDLKGKSILILGAGGAVRGILAPLYESAKRIVIANRTVSRAQDLARHFSHPSGVIIEACGFDALSGQQFDVVLNATAASLEGQVPPIPVDIFAQRALAYDLMYADKPTPFMVWSQTHGASQAEDGLGMLVEQAAESFHLWHGQRPQTGPVIQALRAP